MYNGAGEENNAAVASSYSSSFLDAAATAAATAAAVSSDDEFKSDFEAHEATRSDISRRDLPKSDEKNDAYPPHNRKTLLYTRRG